MSHATVAEVAANLARVQERVEAAGGDPGRVHVVAVTKAFDTAVVRAALGAGLAHIGENYAQELLAKARELNAEAGPGVPMPNWHFIGRLQSNKVRVLAPHVALWQSIDRVELVDELARRAPGAALLVQIDLAHDAGKGGATFGHAPSLVAAARDRGLDVRGLMGLGVAGDDRATFDGFVRLVALADELGLPERSIGMSGDLELAVRAGSTMLRIGRDLFGGRPAR